MIFLKIILACIQRWFHCLIHTFFTNPTHRECSLTTSDEKLFYLRIYCECGKVFGEFKIKKK